MTLCERVMAALVERDDLSQPLPPDLGAHVSGCERCAMRAAHAAALSLGARRAGQALEAQAALSPNAWARVRARVDEAAEARPSASPRAWWLAAAGAVAVAATLWATLDAPSSAQPLAPKPELAQAPAPVAPEPAAPAPKRPRLATALAPLSPAPLPVPGVGDVLGAGHEQRWDAFGRHRVTLGRGAQATVVAWDDDGLVLDLERGRVRADVHRAQPDEVFEIRVGAARVRVLGTVFEVDRQGGERARVSVEHGLVSVVDGRGDDHRVAAGQSLTFEIEPEAPRAARRGDRKPVLPRVAATPPEVERAPTPPTPAPTQAAVERVVEIQVPAQQMPPPEVDAPPTPATPSAVRDQLIRVIARIRGGDCAGALPQLKEIARVAGGRRTPPDILYLMGWCHRRLGNRTLSDAFFDRYQRLAPGGPWALPSGPDVELPLPSAERLSL